MDVSKLWACLPSHCCLYILSKILYVLSPLPVLISVFCWKSHTLLNWTLFLVNQNEKTYFLITFLFGWALGNLVRSTALYFCVRLEKGGQVLEDHFSVQNCHYFIFFFKGLQNLPFLVTVSLLLGPVYVIFPAPLNFPYGVPASVSEMVLKQKRLQKHVKCGLFFQPPVHQWDSLPSPAWHPQNLLVTHCLCDGH